MTQARSRQFRVVCGRVNISKPTRDWLARSQNRTLVNKMNLPSARKASRTLGHPLENGPEGARRPAAPRRQHVLHLRYPQLLFRVVLVTPRILLVTLVTGHVALSSQRGILLGTAAGDHVEPAAGGAVSGHGTLRAHGLRDHSLMISAKVLVFGTPSLCHCYTHATQCRSEYLHLHPGTAEKGHCKQSSFKPTNFTVRLVNWDIRKVSL